MVDSETYRVALCWVALARFLQFFHLVCYQLWDKWYMVLEEVGEYSRQDLLKALLINKLPWCVFSPIYLKIWYIKYIINTCLICEKNVIWFVYVTHGHDVHLFPMPFGPFGQNIHIFYDLESHLICYDLISLLRRTL